LEERYMIKVYSKLFVGSELDYEGIVLHQTGWAVVQACKEPYHSQAVGYPRGKAAPKNSEYYVAPRGNRLILNMVGVPRSEFFHKEEMIDKALDFIDKMRASNQNVLVHCNQGESRCPSIALLYMASRLDALPTDSLEAAEGKFRLIYPNYHPNFGIRGHLVQHWLLYCEDGRPEELAADAECIDHKGIGPLS
jgi:hypothetical protein